MKPYKTIVKFRADFQKLHYLKNEMTMRDLNVWIESWCRKNATFDTLLITAFFDLALAYAETEIQKTIILKRLKKKS